MSYPRQHTALWFLAVLLAPAWPAAAQHVTIAGQVMDRVSSAPLPGANVFISGTTAGAAADQDGRFAFRYPSGQKEVEIVASMVGFEGFSLVVELAGKNEIDLTIRLDEITYSLDEISVTESNAEWKEALAQFQEMIFSTTDNARHCELVEPEWIHIEVNNALNTLTATSSRPMEFVNQALGYRVTLHSPRIYGDPQTFRWEGDLQFQELRSSGDKQDHEWRDRRLEAYNGSTRHFLSTLTGGTTTDQGFRVLPTDTAGKMFDLRLGTRIEDVIEIEYADPTVPTWAVRFEDVLAVTYMEEPEPMRFRRYVDERGIRQRVAGEHQTNRLIPGQAQNSWMELQAPFLLIDQFGNEYGYYSAKRYGFWEWERFCELLPLDYRPDVP